MWGQAIRAGWRLAVCARRGLAAWVRRGRAGRHAAGLTVSALALAGCGQAELPVQWPAYGPQPAQTPTAEWSFAVHPLHNPVLLQQRYGPLVEWINVRLTGVQLRLEASRDYAHFEDKLRQGQPELALPNPYQVVRAQDWGYRVVAKVAGDDEFHGLVLRRKGWQPPPAGRPITVSCPARTALAACMLPLWQLHQEGLDARHPIEVREVGSQESSILNVAHGLVDLGLTWPPPWRLFQTQQPALAQGLEVAWRTPPLVNNGVVARADLDPRLVQAVVAALLDVAADEEGRRRLAQAGMAGFERADDSRYRPVQTFLQEYVRVFGELP